MLNMYLLDICISSLEKCLFGSFAHLKKLGYLGVLLLSYMISLCILGIHALLDMWFTNISFHSIGCLSILIIISFAMQKEAFYFWCNPTYLFLLLLLCFRYHIKKIFAKTNVRELFPSRSFMVCGLILINAFQSNFILLHVVVSSLVLLQSVPLQAYLFVSSVHT